ncbi:MAG: hypothetical protein LBP65_00215 [Puniceicoccales bacterium]|nr:hypothetical protein [Puniceicoccales bacterium]
MDSAKFSVVSPQRETLDDLFAGGKLENAPTFVKKSLVEGGVVGLRVGGLMLTVLQAVAFPFCCLVACVLTLVRKESFSDLMKTIKSGNSNDSQSNESNAKTIANSAFVKYALCFALPREMEEAADRLQKAISGNESTLKDDSKEEGKEDVEMKKSIISNPWEKGIQEDHEGIVGKGWDPYTAEYTD